MTQIEALTRAEELTGWWRKQQRARVFMSLRDDKPCKSISVLLTTLIMQNLDANERADFAHFLITVVCEG